MKQLLLFLFLIPFLNFSQVQIGQDIDGEAALDNFGSSVSISSDGSIIAISAANNDGNGQDSGSTRIYEIQSGNWIQIGQDIDGENAFDRTRSVSLSSDGSIVAIGATGNNGNGLGSGHVRIYENQSGSWVQIGEDINGETANDLSGWSVSLSSNGSIVAIGARFNDGNGNNSGHVRIYENQSGNWVQVGQDIDGENLDDQSGGSVSLSDNGSVVAIGAIGNNNFLGHVRIYENQLGNWVQVGDDIDGEAANDQSGGSVSLSDDGLIVAIGALGNDENGSNSGHVRIYENQSGNWIQIGNDINGEGIEDFSGSSLSMSSDGNILAIGAWYNDGNGNNSGHVRIYENQSGNWIQIGNDIDGEASNDFSGNSISLSDDGSIIAIGASQNSGNGFASGHVRVFDLSDVLSTKDKIISDFKLFPNPTKNEFTIQLENPTDLQNVNIYNNLGQLVLTSKETTIDSSKIASGLYVVEIETTKGKSSKKLIINK